MLKNKPGFTLVELLIVIIIIALLAAISVVVYNGITTRAENTKTINAATAWYKAFQLYKTDHGELPHAGFDSCLGEDYRWDYSGGTSGQNQCLSSPTNGYYITRYGLLNLLRPYFGGSQFPAPSMQAVGDSSNWARGMFYRTPAVGADLTLSVAFKNIPTTADCPTIAGQTAQSSSSRGTNDRSCNYALGPRLR